MSSLAQFISGIKTGQVYYINKEQRTNLRFEITGVINFEALVRQAFHQRKRRQKRLSNEYREKEKSR